MFASVFFFNLNFLKKKITLFSFNLLYILPAMSF